MLGTSSQTEPNPGHPPTASITATILRIDDVGYDDDYMSWHSKLPLSSEQIALHRCRAAAFLSELKPESLAKAWRSYDELTFGNWLQRQCDERDFRVMFSTSGRSTNVGARLVVGKAAGSRPMTMRFSEPFLRAFPVPRIIYGQTCRKVGDVTACLLEHEIVHQAEFLIYGNSSCTNRCSGI